ncbi:MAG TPA: thioredoxin family protein [Vitreimonas sp.]|nr:thioredoxin family protein [Vitreimonas sp.]
MKNFTLVCVVALVVFIAWLSLVTPMTMKQELSDTSLSSTPSPTQLPESVPGPIVTPDANSDNSGGGSYLPFSPEVMNMTSTTRRVLFFYANWCPTCKPADEDFTNNSHRLPADVTVIRVNYNDPDTDETEKALAKKYAVTYQHTYVQIDESGDAVTKWNGGQVEEMLSKLQPSR